MGISAVIPTKNRLRETQAAVKSLLDVSVIDEIIVVVDDLPQEVALFREVLLSVSTSRVHIIPNSLYPGAQGARVSGILAANSDFIFFLDSDDLAICEGILDERDALINDSEICLVYSNVFIGDKRSDFLRLDGYHFSRVLKNLSLCPFSGMMIRKKALDVSRLDLTLPAWQDDDFCLVMSQSGKVKFVESAAAEMRPSTDSISNFKNRQLEGLRIVIARWRKEILKEFGFKYLMLWKLRLLIIYLKHLRQSCISRGTIPLKLSLLCSMVLRLIIKALSLIVRPFFDRIYA